MSRNAVILGGLIFTGNVAPAQVGTLASLLGFPEAAALNNGNGTFTVAPLPVEAQFAPIYVRAAG